MSTRRVGGCFSSLARFVGCTATTQRLPCRRSSGSGRARGSPSAAPRRASPSASTSSRSSGVSSTWPCSSRLVVESSRGRSRRSGGAWRRRGGSGLHGRRNPRASRPTSPSRTFSRSDSRPASSTTRAARSTTTGRRFASSSACAIADELEEPLGVERGRRLVLVPEVEVDLESLLEERRDALRFGGEVVLLVGRVPEAQVAKGGGSFVGVHPGDGALVQALLHFRGRPGLVPEV